MRCVLHAWTGDGYEFALIIVIKKYLSTNEITHLSQTVAIIEILNLPTHRVKHELQLAGVVVLEFHRVTIAIGETGHWKRCPINNYWLVGCHVPVLISLNKEATLLGKFRVETWRRKVGVITRYAVIIIIVCAGIPYV